MQQYLADSKYINWKHPLLVAKARELAHGLVGDEAIAKRCFEFVRDEIEHSWDYRRNPVTCKASDVLAHGTGFCYAKSHLLAALLRANSIPAGMCYQRVAIDTQRTQFFLHGLNAVFLQRFGWYRIDPRGNKPGVAADFHPPKEKLAFSIIKPQEHDFPEICSEPHPRVIEALTSFKTLEETFKNLPDLEQMQLAHQQNV